MRSRFSRAALAAVVALAGLVALEQAQADPPSSNGLGAKVLSWAKSRLRSQVGNGECWTLAHDALEAAGAKRPGQELGVYAYGTPVSLLSVQPGDILQFEGVVFKSPNGATQQMDHHTAIVVTRVRSLRHPVIAILHQNVAGDRTVQYGTININERQSGTIRAFRPVAR